MFGIPCGSYCFTSHSDRSPVLNITNRRRSTRTAAPSAGLAAGSCEEIELKCHNNLGDSRADLLYLNGRYYRRLPRPSCHRAATAARRKLKLELPPASQPDWEPASFEGSHTNEQLNRISIIDVTNDDNSYEEPPVEAPIVEVEGSTASVGPEVAPRAQSAPSDGPIEAPVGRQESDKPNNNNSQLQLVKQEPPQSQIATLPPAELAVVEKPPEVGESGGVLTKQPRSFVRRFHEMLSMRHQQQQQIDQEPFTVMISYVHAEAQKYALSLKKELKRLGVSVYLDLHEIDKGSDWQDSLNRAILSCQAFVPLVTPSYGATLWTGREIKLADVLAKQIIPVNFGQRWPPPALAIQFATIQYVSWLAPDDRNPNARPLMRTFKLRRRVSGASGAGTGSGGGEVLEQSHWHKSCIRSVARQIKQAIERRQMRLASQQLPAETTPEPCYCRAGALPAPSSHDSGFSDSSPTLGLGSAGVNCCRDAATSCALLQAKRKTSDINYGSFRPGPAADLLHPASLAWLKSSLDDRSESDSCEDDDDDDDDERLSDFDDDCRRPEVGTPDSEEASARLLAPAFGGPCLHSAAQPIPTPASQKKRKSSGSNSNSSSFVVTPKNVSKFFTKFKKTLAKR